jgi:hypothetical protein
MAVKEGDVRCLGQVDRCNEGNAEILHLALVMLGDCILVFLQPFFPVRLR